MSRVLRPIGVASRRKRAQGLSYQGDGTLAATCGPNAQTDPSQAGSGCPGAAVEHLLVYIDDGAVVAGQAPADNLREVGRAHGSTMVKDEWSGKPLKSNTDAPITAISPDWLLCLHQRAMTGPRSRAGPALPQSSEMPASAPFGTQNGGVHENNMCLDYVVV